MVRRLLGASYRTARRLVVGVVGASVTLFGVALLFLPGPAFVVIPIGLGILSLEFAWARHWLRVVRERAEALASGGEDDDPRCDPAPQAETRSRACTSD